MKVSNLGPPRGADPARRKKDGAGRGSEFADALKDATAATEAGAAVGAAPVTAPDSLLSVQGVGEEGQRRARALARRYGDEMLDRLEEIRLGLIDGAIPKERLTQLAQAMRQRRQTCSDPRLNDIIAEIELRAEVEIAKLSRPGRS